MAGELKVRCMPQQGEGGPPACGTGVEGTMWHAACGVSDLPTSVAPAGVPRGVYSPQPPLKLDSPGLTECFVKNIFPIIYTTDFAYHFHLMPPCSCIRKKEEQKRPTCLLVV